MQPLDQESNASKGRKNIMQQIGDFSDPGEWPPDNPTDSFFTCTDSNNYQLTPRRHINRWMVKGGKMSGRPTTLDGRPATAPWPPGHRPTSTTDLEHLQVPPWSPRYKYPPGGHLQGVVDQENTSVVV